MSGSINRRSFVRSAALLTAVAGSFPWRAASAALDSGDPKFDGGKSWVAELGKTSDFSSKPKFILARFKNSKGELMDEQKLYVRSTGSGDKPGFSALSAICTHLKCKINYDEDGDKFKCPCHKSEFSLDGAVIKKPAKKNLQDFSASLVAEGGMLFLKQKAE